MALALITDLKLGLVFENGTDSNGKLKYKKKSFANVRLNATEDQLLQTAEALAGLQSLKLVRVERDNEFWITQ